jgi:hypothetical protein
VDHWHRDRRAHRALHQVDQCDRRDQAVNQKMDDRMKMDDRSRATFSLRSSLLLHFLK